MKLVTKAKPVKIDFLRKEAARFYGALVKAALDVSQEIMVVAGELHADEESYLLDKCGSRQADIWGINLYPQFWDSPRFIEFDSMINLRPAENNLSRSVDDEKLRRKIRRMVLQLVKE